MRFRFWKWAIAGGFVLSLGSRPAWAQFSDRQIGLLAEVLLQSVEANGNQPNSWQATNIPLWSNTCMGRSLTPQQFASSPVTARWITICKLREILPTEYRANGSNAAIAVRRAAAWWLTGNPSQFNQGDTASYTQKILSLYQQKKPGQTATASKAPATVSKTPATNSSPQPSPKPSPKPPARPDAATPQPAAKPGTTQPADPGVASQPASQPTASQPPNQSRATVYDRYMLAGYDATKRRNLPTALLYFKRALDERPNDSYAAQAIRNVKSYSRSTPATAGAADTLTTPSPSSPTAQPNPIQPAASPQTPPDDVAPPPPVKLAPPPKKTTAASPSTPPSALPSVAVSSEPPPASITDQQAIDLMNRWLLAKADIFAPPYDQQQVVNLTTGELLASLLKPDGVLAWLRTNRAYFRYGAQKLETIERFVATRDRATLQVRLTEDRTLYLNGSIDPSRTSFAIQRIRFTLASENGTWKIADYKTVDGSLLERSVLEAGK